MLSALVAAGETRVAVLDFVDLTGQASDASLGGDIQRGALASKGVYLLGKALAGREGFVLLDRRDFLAQMEKLQPKDQGEPTPVKPSFLQAAQALNADVVLRGSLVSLSTGKESIHLGGYATDRSTLTTRVSLEALDARDGTVLVVADGSAQQQFRQTEAQKTTLGEDDVLGLMEQALAKAVPVVEKALREQQEKLAARPRVKLSVKTDDDPAMVELDGLLVGSTPLEGFTAYQGDHVLTVSRPGYQQVTKRVLLEKDTSVQVSMLREKLTADELKDIYEKIELKVIDAEPGVIIGTLE
jgi:hypothetical protein